MKNFRLLLIILIFMLSISVSAQWTSAIKDEQGREIIPRGFVVNTEDDAGKLYFDSMDYQRMVKLGANFQVIRLNIGMLGGYPGHSIDENYLKHLDSLVQLGKNSGIRTAFKMTVYGTKDFDWGNFWRNDNGEQKHLEEAWMNLFKRYKDESYVFGYDLLNEPRKGDFDISYKNMEAAHLIPLFQRLINIGHQANPNKKFLYQPMLVNDEDRKNYRPPFIKMKTPVTGDNVMYAPHIYEDNKEKIGDWMNQYESDANVSGTPIFMGEWGNATYNHTDSTLQAQFKYKDFYIETVKVFDSLKVGSIKAWFKGTREIKTNSIGSYTWSLFKDESDSGSIERKYIMDIISRPYPQCVAGEILKYKVDFPTRTMSAIVVGNNKKGASKLFIPADRWYPDGFTVTIGKTVVKYNPLKNIGLEVVQHGMGETASDLIWDSNKQQLVILRWPEEGRELKILIQPGLYQDIIR